MLAKITLYDGTVYRIASQTVDTADGLYLGRIKDELSLVSAMQEAGNAPATVNLAIINHDDFISHSKDLWAADVLLTTDNNISWRGKINFCNFDADGILYVTASEKTAPELELQLPDEVRQVYTIDEDFHQSSVTMTIPLVIGGTTSNPITLPTILIDKTRGIYLICVGEIRSVVKVYNGAKELPQTAYTAYTGTASQEENAGFAYVQIAEDYRLNSDGSYAEINVDVVGLKLGNHTEAECRNGARFLYYFLTTAATGVNGWGCGIDSNLIDITSFNSAITLCDQLGYKLDGIMWLRQSAQSWIDQICQAIHGKYSINANGKRSLFIDYAGNASKKTFTASNMRVDKYGKNSYTSVVYNKGILSYDYNPITGLFMQSAQYENADSIAQIGEQKFVGESYLIKDATTALAVLEYTCKRSQTAAESIEFETDDIETALKAGDVITINRPDLSINNVLYQIQNISTTDFRAQITAVKFDTSVFIVTGSASTVAWGREKSITPALTPAQATNLLLSTGFDINPDGTGIPYISGTFTVPDGGWLAAAVQYGIGTNPSNWTEMALITEGRFKLSPVNVDTVYSIRVRMITATGHSSFITGVITATGDTIPPSKPTISAKATDKTVTIQCGLDTPPADMGGFQIYRKKSTDSESAYTYIGSIAANRGYASITDYVDEYVTYNYQAKSYDRSGNLSTNFSNVASVTVTGITANDVAATALAMPTGSILRLSAKNCTTASIAEDKGVKDCSSWGNHGQAYGGVAVIQDPEMGDCFSFDGTNDYISLPNSVFSLLTGLGGLTIVARVKLNSVSTNQSILSFGVSNIGSVIQLDATRETSNRRIWLGGRRARGNAYTYIESVTQLELNQYYNIVGVFDFLESKLKIYIDGILDSEGDFLAGSYYELTPGNGAIGAVSFGNANRLNGVLSDIRIYPRALSASEIKTIYMFPDDVTFGQMTADLIGTNIIKAKNLIKTESLITTVAQIDQAVVNNLNVSGNATFTNGLANTLQTANTNAQAYATDAANGVSVGGRNLAKGTKTAKTLTFSGQSSAGTNIYDETAYIHSVVLPSVVDGSPHEFVYSFDWSTTATSGLFTFQRNGTPYLNGPYTRGSGDAGITISSTNQSGHGVIRIKTTDTRAISGTKFQLLAKNVTGNITISNFKIEVGNKATTWTPAPEDVDADATEKANTAKTEAIADSKSYADTELAKKMSIAAYCAANDTTKIDGGTIYSNSIYASSLNVYGGTPRSCIFSLNFKSVQAATAGTDVPDFSGNNNSFKIKGTWTMLSKGAAFAEYILLDNTAAGRSHYLANQKDITVPASGWTFLICAYAHANGSGEHILFDFKPNSGDKNRIQFRIDPDNNRIRIRSWNSSGTTESKYGALASCTRNSYRCYIVQCTSTTSITVYCVDQRRGDQLDESSKKVTITLSNARSALTSPAAYMQIGGTGSTSEATASIVGNIGDIQFYNRALSKEELAYVVHEIGNYESGLITAERIDSNALKSKNFTDTDPDILAGKAFSTAGSFLNLAGGTMTAPKFRYGSDGSCQIGSFLVQSDGSLKSAFGTSGYVELKYNKGLRILDPAHDSDAEFNPASTFWTTNATGFSQQVYVVTSNNGSTKDAAIIKVNPNSTSLYGLYVKGKARIWDADVTSDESLKKDFKEVSTLDKLKNLRVLSWKFDEEKIVEEENIEIDAENAEIIEENKVIDAENAEIEKENERRKSRKDGGEDVELLPLKEHKKLKNHKIADKTANHALKIGCMAGEFNKAFGTNNGSEDCLSVTDTIGVCMRAIQELAAEVDELKALLKTEEKQEEQK